MRGGEPIAAQNVGILRLLDLLCCSDFPNPSPGCSTSLLLDRTFICRQVSGIVLEGASRFTSVAHVWVLVFLPDLAAADRLKEHVVIVGDGGLIPRSK